jgi:hypothetical protein
MAQHAFEVLETAFKEAEQHPIENTPAVRLAIGWLVLDGLANRMQAERFVKAMTTQGDVRGTVEGYMRYTEMSQMLEAWKREFRARDWKAQG